MTMDSAPTVPSLALEPTPEEALLRKTVSEIVGRYGHACYMAASAQGEPMTDLWNELADAGFIGLNIP